MRLWIDDIRPAPEGYIWVKSVNEAEKIIYHNLCMVSNFQGTINNKITVVDIDHDAGNYASQGGDYIKLLDWLEAYNDSIDFIFHIHSQNPVGVENMRRIIKRNGWKEV